MKQFFMCFIFFQLIIYTGNMVLFSNGSISNISNIYWLNAFMLFFMIFIVILNSYQFFAKRKYILLIFTAFTLLCFYAEMFNYVITGMSFYEAFWDLMSFEFIKSSILVYWQLFIMFSILFALKMFLTYKMFTLQQQHKILYRIDKVYKLFILAIVSVFVAMGCSFMSLAYSYANYILLKDIRSPKYLNSQPSKEDLTVTSINNKNVVHIILESYANAFVSKDIYKSLTPNFRELINEGIYLKNLEQVEYATYSEAGNVMANKGRMVYVGKTMDDYGFTYLLKQAGYNTAFYRGSKKTAGGFKFKEIYSKENGVDEYYYEDKYINAAEKNEKSVWGVSDDYVFSQVLEKYKALQKEGKPFYLGAFTLDTHISQEISNKCKKDLEQLDDSITNSIFLDAVACTDYIVGNFINELKKLPNFENTLIIIHADHMPYFVNDLLMDEPNKQFGLIINSKNGSFVQNNTSYIFDVPATIISELEIKSNYKPLLGEDISQHDFIRSQKTDREQINVFDEVDYDDFSTNPIAKALLKIKGFYDYERSYQ